MSAFGFGDQQTTQAPFGGFSFGPSSTSAPSFTAQPAFGTSTFGSSAPASGIAQTAPSFSTTGFPASSVTGFPASSGTGFPASSGTGFPASSGTGFPISSGTGFPTLGQTAASTSSGFTFGGFGTTAPASSVALGTGTSLLPAATTASVGLGGVDVQSSTATDGANLSSKKDFKAAKESQTPNEISVIVESFKKYVKEQKAVREEMSRVSSKNIARVQEQAAALRQQLSVVSNGLQRNAIAIAKLKEESNKELKNAEIAQRTKDAPASLQYENSAPTEYFHDLANSFEKQMQTYRQQIEQLERHLLSLSQPYSLTPNEWTAIRRRLHDTFVTLAAQLQSVHQEVQVCKEHLMNSQKLNHSDVRNLYENLLRETVRDSIPQKYLPADVTYGPSPFAALQSAVGKAIKGFSRSQQLPGFAGSMQPSFISSRVISSTSFKPLGPSGVPSLSGSSFGDSLGLVGVNAASSAFGTSLDSQKPFQLQKPPAGNKRGKRWTST